MIRDGNLFRQKNICARTIRRNVKCARAFSVVTRLKRARSSAGIKNMRWRYCNDEGMYDACCQYWWVIYDLIFCRFKKIFMLTKKHLNTSKSCRYHPQEKYGLSYWSCFHPFSTGRDISFHLFLHVTGWCNLIENPLTHVCVSLRHLLVRGVLIMHILYPHTYLYKNICV